MTAPIQIPFDDALHAILTSIAAERRSKVEWAAIESSDMFQTTSYAGGYDATEQAFCFSYYAPDGREYWFQLTLEDVDTLLKGSKATIEARFADSSPMPDLLSKR